MLMAAIESCWRPGDIEVGLCAFAARKKGKYLVFGLCVAVITLSQGYDHYLW